MDQYVAMLSIIVNDKTLKKVKYVNCNFTNWSNDAISDSFTISSKKAYIVNATCPFQPQSTIPNTDYSVTNFSECLQCLNILNTDYPATNFSLNTAHKENLLVITMVTSILLLVIIMTIL